VTTIAIKEKGQPEAVAQSLVAHELARLLADTYALDLKTQGYHWNVRRPRVGGSRNTADRRPREGTLDAPRNRRR
jgi:hypothetical protein